MQEAHPARPSLSNQLRLQHDRQSQKHRCQRAGAFPPNGKGTMGLLKMWWSDLCSPWILFRVWRDQICPHGHTQGADQITTPSGPPYRARSDHPEDPDASVVEGRVGRHESRPVYRQVLSGAVMAQKETWRACGKPSFRCDDRIISPTA